VQDIQDTQTTKSANKNNTYTLQTNFINKQNNR